MKREVASLTKMMTFYTLLKLLVKYQLWPRQTYVTVSKTASKVIGTTANLIEGDVLTVEQLCYGMMLPSGNDAAYAIAEHFGQFIYEQKHISPCNQKSKFVNTPLKYFLKEMNLNVVKLKMTNSFYDSPHGLMNKSNYSSAEDQAILVTECMKFGAFRKVVNTREYHTQAMSS